MAQSPGVVAESGGSERRRASRPDSVIAYQTDPSLALIVKFAVDDNGLFIVCVCMCTYVALKLNLMLCYVTAI